MTRAHMSDVVVVGGGTIGSAVGMMLAEEGLEVTVLEQRAQAEAGGDWVTDVPPRLFDLAGLERPVAPVRRRGDTPYLLMGPGNRGMVFLDQNPMWSIETRFLTRELTRRAIAAGAKYLDGIKLRSVDLSPERPARLDYQTREGESREIGAPLVIDATGVAGAIRGREPLLARCCPSPRPDELCDAMRFSYRVVDRDAAGDYLRSWNVPDDTVLVWIGLEGGYSTLIVHLSEDLEHVDILAGVMAEGRVRSSRRIIDEFLHDNKWVGEPISGGRSLIPVRGPYPVFARNRVALVGDSACQVFPVNGCGIGSGLVGARCLADAVSLFRDPGDPGALERYQDLFWEKVGRIHAAYEPFRRFSLGLGRRQIANLVHSGLMSPQIIRHTLQQEVPSFDLDMGLTGLRAALKSPGLALGMSPAVAGLFLKSSLPRKAMIRRGCR